MTHVLAVHDVRMRWLNLLSIAFLLLTITLLLRHLFQESLVTFDTISAALCAYLLLGVLWAFLYSTIVVFQPDAFLAPASGQEQIMRFGAANSAMPLYFSYVTLTTLGYGDIVPLSMSARMFTTLEAIMGQMFLAVLVARLVGLHIAQDARRAPR